MKISTDYPPNIAQIRQYFPVDDIQPIFTYGDTIYNPYHHDVTADIEAHEAVHAQQQFKMSPSVWWDEYCASPSFRLTQEAEAYGCQYGFLCKTHTDRNQQVRILNTLASFLSGKLYGSIMNMQDATKQIKHYAGQ